MAYKYFTKDLIAKGTDLTIYFPEKQARAKQINNTSYSFPEIVMWLKDNTDNFKKTVQYCISMDQSIMRIVNSYYDINRLPNPFKESDAGDTLPPAQNVRKSQEVGQPMRTIAKPIQTAQAIKPIQIFKKEEPTTTTEAPATKTKADYQATINGFEFLLKRATTDERKEELRNAIEGQKFLMSRAKMEKGGGVDEFLEKDYDVIADYNKVSVEFEKWLKENPTASKGIIGKKKKELAEKYSVGTCSLKSKVHRTDKLSDVMADGGRIKLSGEAIHLLKKVDVTKLKEEDATEYNELIGKGYSREDALLKLINDIYPDYDELSDELEKITEKLDEDFYSSMAMGGRTQDK